MLTLCLLGNQNSIAPSPVGERQPKIHWSRTLLPNCLEIRRTRWVVWGLDTASRTLNSVSRYHSGRVRVRLETLWYLKSHEYARCTQKLYGTVNFEPLRPITSSGNAPALERTLVSIFCIFISSVTSSRA